LEIIIILAIMGILMVMVGPPLLREMQRARVEQSVTQTVTLFQSVRMRAIRDNNDYDLSFDQAKHEISANVSGIGTGTSDSAIIRLEDLDMRFYPPGYSSAPDELKPPAADCPVPPATITYNNVGNVTNVPVSFCLTDILGNVMQISVESPLGQPRIYKYITNNDPHGRYTLDVAGFVQETDGGQAWRWY
jgi:type II secretory pathway pseudopilin PulG